MSELRSALDRFRHVWMPRKTLMLAPDNLRNAIDQLGSNGVERRVPAELEEIQARVLLLAGESRMADATRSELRCCARNYLSGPRPVGRERSVREKFLSEVGRRGKRSALLGLTETYVFQFSMTDEAIIHLGSWLQDSVRHWTFKDADTWRQRSASARLFNPEACPKHLAVSALATGNAKQVLSDLGLGEAAIVGNLGESAFRLACNSVRSARDRLVPTLQSHLMAWGQVGGRFAYDKCWPEYARALLEPWNYASIAAELKPDHRARIVNELIGYAGDPRTGNRTKWGMLDGTAAKDVLLRWLTRASVLQFLDIVDRTADAHMWSYRRAFWTSYLVADHIDAAWVAFGDNGAHLAREIARQSKDAGLGQFGEVERGTGRTPDHAALIMKIGDLTIVDWSHNGKYNIWRRGDAGAPILFARRYSGYALSSGALAGSHTYSENFSWQRKIAQEIVRHTGRRVAETRWMPARRV